MQSDQKEIKRTVQILLWLWFGTMTSFVINNTVNIAKLETQVSDIKHREYKIQQTQFR
jgi:hypothetical protein